MVRRLVISLYLGIDVMEYVKIVPVAGKQLVKKLIYDISCDHELSIRQYEILVVLRRLTAETNSDHFNIDFSQSIAWQQKFYFNGRYMRVDPKIDNKVEMVAERVIKKFSHKCLAFMERYRLYTFDIGD